MSIFVDWSDEPPEGWTTPLAELDPATPHELEPFHIFELGHATKTELLSYTFKVTGTGCLELQSRRAGGLIWGTQDTASFRDVRQEIINVSAWVVEAEEVRIVIREVPDL